MQLEFELKLDSYGIEIYWILILIQFNIRIKIQLKKNGMQIGGESIEKFAH
jgi:hypothetical protein